MGCVSSNLLNQEDDFTQLGSSVLGHHIVSLTSTTYGFLNLDPPTPTQPHNAINPPAPPPRLTLGSIFLSPLSEPKLLQSDPEVINSWELMSCLDSDSSFCFCSKLKGTRKENSNPNLKPLHTNFLKVCNSTLKGKNVPDELEKLCPPSGENKLVIYTTTLTGIRKTYEECNAVKSVMEKLGLEISERDISMDVGFKEELRELMKDKEREAMVPPRVFVKGRCIGGAEEVLKIVEEGWFGELIEGIPKRKAKGVCEGCGDVRFLPCFECNGSCKLVMNVKEEKEQKQETSVVVRCPDCNENGLVLCPICS
ncbi:uncharacterized protein At5g39865-like [Mangifera indica]|uniref:uncharacterized protein At5g39865-like n=1 Tax=Mangifera indica TaxID=29780 RepID=UPI001CF9B5B0|nr:uncharacterized protein At5g39865-like [Mangifera indica]